MKRYNRLLEEDTCPKCERHYDISVYLYCPNCDIGRFRNPGDRKQTDKMIKHLTRI
jgi:hypothetical protein